LSFHDYFNTSNCRIIGNKLSMVAVYWMWNKWMWRKCSANGKKSI